LPWIGSGQSRGNLGYVTLRHNVVLAEWLILIVGEIYDRRLPIRDIGTLMAPECSRGLLTDNLPKKIKDVQIEGRRSLSTVARRSVSGY
jgi:hypothetical protein